MHSIVLCDCVLLSAAVGTAYVLLNPHEPPLLRRTALLYCLGAAVESLAEPLYIVAQANLLTGVRASAEVGAALVRGGATFALMVWLDWGVLAFGAAQVLHGLTVLAVYVAFFASKSTANSSSGGGATKTKKEKKIGGASFSLDSLVDLLPRRLPSAVATPTANATFTGAYFDVETLKLAGYFSFQSVSKHLLTEGDRIVLSVGASLHDQGVFVMAQNYGSLAVRVLLQPIEESSRLLFSKMAAARQQQATAATAGGGRPQ